MPLYLTDKATWITLWPMVLAAIFFALLYSSLFGVQQPSRSFLLFRYPVSRTVFLVALAFTSIGIITGYITGLSRAPAVGAVLPAVLSLVAGMTIYMIGKDTSHRDLVGMALLGLATTLLLGAVWGAEQRDTHERFKQSEDYMKHQARVEANLKMYKAWLNAEYVDRYLEELSTPSPKLSGAKQLSYPEGPTGAKNEN